MFLLIGKLIGLTILSMLIYSYPLIIAGVIGDTLYQRGKTHKIYYWAVAINTVIQTYVYSIFTAILFIIAYTFIQKEDTINWIIWIVVFACNIVPIFYFSVFTNVKVKAGDINHSAVNANSLSLVVITSILMFSIFLLFPKALDYYSWIPFVNK